MSAAPSRLGRFTTRHALAITFIAAVLCLAGVFAALRMPSSVFPVTAFPRIVVGVSNGIMPPDQMMATITRPIEESLKSIPEERTVLSTTTRGSAIINVEFPWGTDMHRAELYVLGRIAEIRSELPAGTTTDVRRVGFTLSYPVIGISLSSSDRSLRDLWNTATYTIKPLFLQIPGISRVEVLGGHVPEYHVIVDPLKLQATHLSLRDVTAALEKNNVIASAGLLARNYRLYLTTVDGRVHSIAQIENIVIVVRDGHPVRVQDVARVVRAPAPAYTSMTANGHQAVLLQIESHSNASVLAIASALKSALLKLHGELPPDERLAFFYDQSSFVRDSIGNVWDAVLFGLALSVIILYLFLRNWGSVWTAVVTIPISVLITFVAMKLAGMSFNMMTLGGIAASIGLIIDNAIVVVEAMCHSIARGGPRLEGIYQGIGEVLTALIGSTLTPVVVFLPLIFLTGIAGVFFRALGLSMVVALLVSLLLALTLTPSLAAWMIRGRAPSEEGGFILQRILRLYDRSARWALRHTGVTLLCCGLILIGAIFVYRHLETGFLPNFDEGGFNIDFTALPGTSLAETSRTLDEAERVIRDNPDVAGYSRQLGAQLGPYLNEPYKGSYLIKLKANRRHTTDEVMARIRHQLDRRFPMVRWDIKGFLTDVVGDLQLAPYPVEVRLFSPDLAWLKKTAPRVEAQLRKIPGLVDTFDGLTVIGPEIDLRMRRAEAARFGLTTQDIASTVDNALLGKVSSYVLEGDRVVGIRVLEDPSSVARLAALRNLPLRTPTGALVRLEQVASVGERPNQVELNRDNLRQDDIVSARLEGVDLGTAMREVRATLSRDKWLPPGVVRYAGQYRLQQQSFANLLVVLLSAILLVFTVLLVEFRSFYEPIAIIFGAVLALFGAMVGLWLDGITLNIVSYLGAIIGVGIVAKNGILVLDQAQQLRAQGTELTEALIQAGHRRLRPVLMTSLAAALGMLPLAYGAGAGAQMLQPLGIAVMGALFLSVPLSLIATPVLYYLLVASHRRYFGPRSRMEES
ncbi:MAG: efflux RND transporter permease subunit [Steroidobacteraceae bacterium]